MSDGSVGILSEKFKPAGQYNALKQPIWFILIPIKILRSKMLRFLKRKKPNG
jgi:hypothetical protein